jgi:hypothetical protein
VGCDRCAAVGFDGKDVGLEGEGVDELVLSFVSRVMHVVGAISQTMDARGISWVCASRGVYAQYVASTYVCIYALWERVDVRRKFYGSRYTEARRLNERNARCRSIM